jgi:transcriptional regulator with XRE-family HTH domain
MQRDKFQEELEAIPGFREAERRALPGKTVALAIAAIRAEYSLTQAELAAKIGTTQSVISRLESGRRAPSTRILDQIGEALGLTWTPVFEPLAKPAPAVALPEAAHRAASGALAHHATAVATGRHVTPVATGRHSTWVHDVLLTYGEHAFAMEPKDEPQLTYYVGAGAIDTEAAVEILKPSALTIREPLEEYEIVQLETGESVPFGPDAPRKLSPAGNRQPALALAS